MIAKNRVKTAATKQAKTKAKVTKSKAIKSKIKAKPKKTIKDIKKTSTTKTKVTSSNIVKKKTAKKFTSTDKLLQPNKFKPYKPTKDELYMNSKQLAHFKNILERWKYDLMQEVDHTLMEMKEAGIPADLNDRATQEEAFSLELKTRDRERKLLKKIDDAIKQIEKQDYGYCESCGIEIGIRRLEARPTATLCIDCKTLAEIREKRA